MPEVMTTNYGVLLNNTRMKIIFNIKATILKVLIKHSTRRSKGYYLYYQKVVL